MPGYFFNCQFLMKRDLTCLNFHKCGIIYLGSQILADSEIQENLHLWKIILYKIFTNEKVVYASYNLLYTSSTFFLLMLMSLG